ncbi:MAG TPA: class I SAM-dependent methyltransferase [Allocoleopsis sp.]
MYKEDLAYIHDVGFGDFAIKSAPGLLTILKAKGIDKGLIIDLACGSGIWAKILTDSGYEVLGIDISESMLNLANKKAPLAQFQCGSLFRLNLPLCDAITCMGEGINYQFDHHRDDDIKQLFQRIYESLKPGGVFIFDIIEPGYITGNNPQKIYFTGEDWDILLQTEENKNTQVLTRKIIIFRKVGELYRRSEETHSVKLYKSRFIAEKLRKVGFKVKIMRGYGELRFRKAKVGFMAVKLPVDN